MSHDYYSEDLGEILSCARERRMVMEILQAWDRDGLPDDFDDSGVKVAFNKSSRNVFLVNEDYQVAMMNGDELETFYTSPWAGVEGFLADLLDEYPDMHPKDKEWFEAIAKQRDVMLPSSL